MHVNTLNEALIMGLDDFEWNIMFSVLSVLLTPGICQHFKRGHLYFRVCLCNGSKVGKRRKRCEMHM